MSTISLRAPRPTFASTLVQAGAKFGSALTAVFDIFADAQDMARAAHRRYPFAEW
jgi:hypothetical protein